MQVSETALVTNFERGADSGFMPSGQVGVSLRGNDQVLVMFASPGIEGDVMANDVPVVCGS